jgi:hypothetical protein
MSELVRRLQAAGVQVRANVACTGHVSVISYRLDRVAVKGTGSDGPTRSPACRGSWGSATTAEETFRFSSGPHARRRGLSPGDGAADTVSGCHRQLAR